MSLPTHVSQDIAGHLEAIQRHFKASKITLICRATGFADGSRDLVMGDDNLDDAVNAVRTQQQIHRSPKGGSLPSVTVSNISLTVSPIMKTGA